MEFCNAIHNVRVWYRSETEVSFEYRTKLISSHFDKYRMQFAYQMGPDLAHALIKVAEQDDHDHHHSLGIAGVGPLNFKHTTEQWA